MGWGLRVVRKCQLNLVCVESLIKEVFFVWGRRTEDGVGGGPRMGWEEDRGWGGRRTEDGVGGGPRMGWEEDRGWGGRRTEDGVGGGPRMGWEEDRGWGGRRTEDGVGGGPRMGWGEDRGWGGGRTEDGVGGGPRMGWGGPRIGVVRKCQIQFYEGIFFAGGGGMKYEVVVNDLSFNTCLCWKFHQGIFSLGG